MRLRLRHALPALALALVTATPTAAAPPADRAALTGLADEIVQAGAPGAIIARRAGATEDALTAVARGRADIDSGRPAAPGDRYRIGSNTKPMVAVVVLQLVQEGRLDLDDPVDKWLPRFGLDERITVRHLLMQTSGFRTNTMIASPPYGYDYNRFHYFHPDELVRIALTNPEPRHVPGERFEYSNTNYVLAGLVIERVTHHSVQRELQRRIFGKLGLRDTSFPAYNPLILGRHLDGYLPNTPEEPLVDTTVYSMSWVWTAGAVISTAEDETTFLRALFNGRLLSDELLLTMTTPGPNGVYAMGLFRLPLACAPGEVVWGHDGIVFGYFSAAFSTADGSVQTAAVGNAWILDENGSPSGIVTRAAALAVCGDVASVDQPGEPLEQVAARDVAHS